MKRLLAGGLALGMWSGAAGLVIAQSSLDALDQELKEAQQQHDDATAQNLSNFFSQVDQAMTGTDAAVALWQQAGGSMPTPTPVSTQYSSETASERDARAAKDKANVDAMGNVLQFHCAMLHYAAIFVTDPNRKGLQDDFNAWLQKAAQVYPQLVPPATSDAGTAPGGEHHHHHDGGGDAGGGAPPPPFNFSDIKGKTMKDSLISKFLGFKAWKDKEQGGWSVKQIPALYKSNILDPSRATPTATTLANWDVYIAMMQADEPDSDKWTSTDYPPLQFERAYDECTVTPGTEKIEVLVQLIHANPTDPNSPDWLKRTKDLIDTYRASHGGASPSTVAQNNAPASTNGNVTVVQQGDAQIITTHSTNAAPVNPGH